MIEFNLNSESTLECVSKVALMKYFAYLLNVGKCYQLFPFTIMGTILSSFDFYAYIF